MSHSNIIKFRYGYAEGVTDVEKCYIDNAITFALNKAFYEMYHEGLIANFYLIDEDMKEGD